MKGNGRWWSRSVEVVLFACLVSLAEVDAEDGPKPRPNILFCMADDWGWPHAGAYGDKVVATPAFDRLAKEGMLFDSAFVSSPSCSPSRNAMLTGQQFYRLEEGASLWNCLDVRYPNFMFLLRDSGYEIGHWSKAWGPGFYERGGYQEHPCGPEIDFGKFLKDRKKEKPFCFWLGTHDPHRAYKKGSGVKSGIPVDKVRVPAFYPDVAEIRSDIADYYFEVQRWDHDVAHALELLEKDGLLDNTIVVMTSDHGMPFPRCKANLYDWGTRVPLAIRWGKSIRQGAVEKRLVSLTDLAPTFLEAAGVTIPAAMTGQSLLPLMANGGKDVPEWRDFLVYGRERHTTAQEKPSTEGYPSRAIRNGDWLLILNLESSLWPAGVPNGANHPSGQFSDSDDGPTKKMIIAMKDDAENGRYYDLCFSKRPEVELYNCRDDPDQVINLATNPEYGETVARMRAKLVDHLKTSRDPRFNGGPVKFNSYPYK